MNTLVFHPTDVAADATHSFFAHDPYIETFWLPLLGPTATWLMNDLCLRALIQQDSFSLQLNEISLRIGIGSREGSSSPVMKQLSRLCQAHVLYRHGENEYLVPRTIEPPRTEMFYKLKEHKRLHHKLWMTRLLDSPAETQRRRIRALVTRLEMMGFNAPIISTTLLATGLHPSIIGEAIAQFALTLPTSHKNTAA